MMDVNSILKKKVKDVSNTFFFDNENYSQLQDKKTAEK